MPVGDKPEAIDADVWNTARHFGIDPMLIQAVVTAEGGGDHITIAVRCSVPQVQTRAEALAILCRSAVHAMSDYTKAHHAAEFVAFFGSRWAPIGADNDPTDLNGNWVRNTLAIWNPPHPPQVV